MSRQPWRLRHTTWGDYLKRRDALLPLFRALIFTKVQPSGGRAEEVQAAGVTVKLARSVRLVGASRSA
jgi:hypothetical protein